MKNVLKIITNKYFIAVIGFLVLMFFFDKNDIFSQVKRKRELNELTTKVAYYKTQNQLANTELQGLQSNPATLEKYAREKFLMKRDNEEIFVLDTSRGK